MCIFDVALKVYEQSLKDQASLVKKREDELGTIVAQMQIEKAKPVALKVVIVFSYLFLHFAFNVLTPFVGHQEEHPACKKTE